MKTLASSLVQKPVITVLNSFNKKQYEILSFDASAANIYSDLYERLKAKGAPAQRFDLMIASIAISNNLILVTRNVSDFTAIAENSNLMIENWFEE